jgi:hypothetical protein
MEPINEVHRELKKFLSRHGGYSRENLQDWLNLFAFIFNTPGDKYQKAQIFIEMAIKMRMNCVFANGRSLKCAADAIFQFPRVQIGVFRLFPMGNCPMI